jgi:hypothetical protein
MLSSKLLAEWLTAKTQTMPLPLVFEVGPDVSEYLVNDKSGVITVVSGFGSEMEDLVDRPVFQVRVRAREHQLDELEQTAQLLDRVLCREAGGQAIWGTWVIAVARTGPGPTALQEDTSERRAFACNYFARVEL